MKRIYSLLLMVVVMFGLMLYVSPKTYGASDPRITYEKVGNYVYILIDGEMNLVYDGSSKNLSADFRDSGFYTVGYLPESFTIEYYEDRSQETTVNTFNPTAVGELFGTVAISSLVAYADFETDDGYVYQSGTVYPFEQGDAIYMYWELPFIDASPVIDGETAFVTDVDTPMLESEILTYINAWDETDGDITHLIVKVSDTYTPNMNTVGTWQIVYSVEDTAGNEATLTVHVLVRDVTSPTWSHDTKNHVEVSYTQTFDVDAYKLQLGATDNYDPSGSLVITVQSNTYTANKTVVGDYTVVYKIKDTAGNETLANVQVSVIDTVAPVFSGPTTLGKANTSVLLLSDIKAQLTANDAINGNLTASIIVISDNYTGNGHLVGSYAIQFSVSDASGNIAYHTVTVNVYDNLPPVFYVRDNFFIAVESSVSLTLEQIIDILQITGQITVDGTGGVQITTLLNEYTGNEQDAGIYAVSFRTVTPSGNESIYNVAVEVLTGDEEDPIVIDEDQPWYEPVVDLYHTVASWVSGHILESIGIALFLIGLVVIAVVSSNKKTVYYPRKR